MAIYEKSSRFVKYSRVATATDRRGRLVSCLTPAEIPARAELGRHRLKQGQRLDRLAAHYLKEPTAFWRIAELNDAMTAEAALDEPLVKIPMKG